ncbi:Required for respiratory growth protein 9 mitochondrial [Dimargaris xerosporica]|nr:Required for respiratory growth protein 9 mitochondrial [Dimargaris xerosporica]
MTLLAQTRRALHGWRPPLALTQPLLAYATVPLNRSPSQYQSSSPSDSAGFSEHPDFPNTRSRSTRSTPSAWGQRLKDYVDQGGHIMDIEPLTETSKPKPVASPKKPPTSNASSDDLHTEGWRMRKNEQSKVLQGARWSPTKRVARSTMERIRFLRTNLPDTYTIPRLSAEFKISFEAVRRILKSKYIPSERVRARQEEKRMAKREAFEQASLASKSQKPSRPTLPKPRRIPSTCSG